MGWAGPAPEELAECDVTELEDDYLAGPINAESYVIFRTRPSLEMLEQRGRQLSLILQTAEVIVFCVQTTSTCLAVAT